jgi:hypothetical protein
MTTRLELCPDGYERMEAKIQSITDLANKGLFNPDAAHTYLWEVYGGIRELRQTLREVCILAADTADPPGPGVA